MSSALVSCTKPRMTRKQERYEAHKNNHNTHATLNEECERKRRLRWRVLQRKREKCGYEMGGNVNVTKGKLHRHNERAKLITLQWYKPLNYKPLWLWWANNFSHFYPLRLFLFSISSPLSRMARRIFVFSACTRSFGLSSSFISLIFSFVYYSYSLFLHSHPPFNSCLGFHLHSQHSCGEKLFLSKGLFLVPLPLWILFTESLPLRFICTRIPYFMFNRNKKKLYWYNDIIQVLPATTMTITHLQLSNVIYITLVRVK